MDSFQNLFAQGPPGKTRQKTVVDRTNNPQTMSLIVRFYDPDIAAGDVRGRKLEEILDWADEHLEMSHDYIQWLFPLPEGSIFNFNAPVINEEVMDAFRGSYVLRHRLSISFMRMVRFYGFKISPEPEETTGVVAEKEDGEGQKKDSRTKTEMQMEAEVPKEAIAKDEDQAPTEGDEQTHLRNDSAATVEYRSGLDSTLSAKASKAEVGLLPPKTLMGYYVVREDNWKQASRRWCKRSDHNHLRITRILRCLRVLGLQKECDAFYEALKRTYNDPEIHIGETSMIFWRRAVRQELHIAPDGERVAWLKAWVERQSKEPVEKRETKEEAEADRKV